VFFLLQEGTPEHINESYLKRFAQGKAPHRGPAITVMSLAQKSACQDASRRIRGKRKISRNVKKLRRLRCIHYAWSHFEDFRSVQTELRVSVTRYYYRLFSFA